MLLDRLLSASAAEGDSGQGQYGESYTYDANGNMTECVVDGVTYTQAWDAENRLASVTGGGHTTTLAYDANGALVKKAVDGQTTVCPSALLRPGVGQHYEKNVTTGTVTKYPSSSNLIVVEVAHSFAPPGFL